MMDEYYRQQRINDAAKAENAAKIIRAAVSEAVKDHTGTLHLTINVVVADGGGGGGEIKMEWPVRAGT